MRVRFLTQYYLPQPLANAEVVGAICTGLAALGHEVDVVTPAPGAADGDGVIVHRVFGTFAEDRSSTVGRLLEYLTFSVGALVGGFRGPAPDILVVPSPPPTLGVIGLIVARIRRHPLAYVVQDLYPEVALASGALRPGPFLALLARVMRAVYRRCAVVIVIDATVIPLIGRLAPGTPVRAVRNGIDLGPFERSGRDAPWLASLGVDPSLPVVMYAGNVGRSQDLDAVVRATAACGAQLVVHGGGAALDNLRREAAATPAGWSHVHFSTFVERDRLGSVYGSADLHVVPLKPGISSASVPSKLLSIFASGRPALVAAEHGSAAANLVDETGGGWTVDPGDEASLTRAMRSALAEPDELARRGRLAAAWAHPAAGTDRVAAEYAAVLAEAVGHD